MCCTSNIIFLWCPRCDVCTTCGLFVLSSAFLDPSVGHTMNCLFRPRRSLSLHSASACWYVHILLPIHSRELLYGGHYCAGCCGFRHQVSLLSLHVCRRRWPCLRLRCLSTSSVAGSRDEEFVNKKNCAVAMVWPCVFQLWRILCLSFVISGDLTFDLLTTK